MMTRTVTLYHRQGGQPATWTRHILEDVFFREAAGTALSPQSAAGGQLESLLLVPAAAGIAPRPGDGVLFGVGPEEGLTGDIRECVPRCRIVTAVTGRRYGSAMDHWEVKLR